MYSANQHTAHSTAHNTQHNTQHTTQHTTQEHTTVHTHSTHTTQEEEEEEEWSNLKPRAKWNMWAPSVQDEEFPAPSPGPQKGASVLNRTNICKIGVGALVLRSVFGPIGSKAKSTAPRYVKHTQAQNIFQNIIDLQPPSLTTKMVHLGPIGARRGISSPQPWPSRPKNYFKK